MSMRRTLQPPTDTTPAVQDWATVAMVTAGDHRAKGCLCEHRPEMTARGILTALSALGLFACGGAEPAGSDEPDTTAGAHQRPLTVVIESPTCFSGTVSVHAILGEEGIVAAGEASFGPFEVALSEECPGALPFTFDDAVFEETLDVFYQINVAETYVAGRSNLVGSTALTGEDLRASNWTVLVRVRAIQPADEVRSEECRPGPLPPLPSPLPQYERICVPV